MRYRQSAATTVKRMPLRFTPASFTEGREVFSDSWNLSAVNIFVAGFANRHAVGNVIPKFGIIFPILDVMGLEIILFATILASVIISGINSLTPISVFSGIAFLVCIIFGHRGILAFFGTKLCIKMPAQWVKRFSALFAYYSLSCPQYFVTLFRTSCVMLFKRFNKFLLAHNTNFCSAIVAIKRCGGFWGKQFPASSTFFYWVCSVHRTYYTTLRYIQRWVDVTNGTPELVN